VSTQTGDFLSSTLRPASKPELSIAVDIEGIFTDGVATLESQGRICSGKTLITPADPGKTISTVIADLLR
jgi:hypothetical protein